MPLPENLHHQTGYDIAKIPQDDLPPKYSEFPEPENSSQVENEYFEPIPSPTDASVVSVPIEPAPKIPEEDEEDSSGADVTSELPEEETEVKETDQSDNADYVSAKPVPAKRTKREDRGELTESQYYTLEEVAEEK